MQIYFFIMIDFMKISLFNGYLLLGYSTLFTMLPVFALIFDFDADRETALKYPLLYKSLSRGYELTTKTFLVWLWISFFQGFVILMFNFWFFQEAYRDFITLSFSALIFVQLLNSFDETHSNNYIVFASIGISILMYILTFIFFGYYFDVTPTSFWFFIKSFVVAIIAFLPVKIMKRFSLYLYPTEERKLMISVGFK